MASEQMPRIHQLNLTDDQFRYLYYCMRGYQLAQLFDIELALKTTLAADQVAVSMGEEGFTKFCSMMDEHFKRADCGNPACTIHGHGVKE